MMKMIRTPNFGGLLLSPSFPEVAVDFSDVECPYFFQFGSKPEDFTIDLNHLVLQKEEFAGFQKAMQGPMPSINHRCPHNVDLNRASQMPCFLVKALQKEVEARGGPLFKMNFAIVEW